GRAPGSRIPELDRAVVAPSGQGLAVRTEGNGHDSVRVSSQTANLSAVDHVPDFCLARLLELKTTTGGSEQTPVLGERNSLDRTGVARERDDFRAGGGVPHLDGAVVGSGGKQAAVGTKHDRGDAERVAAGGKQLAPCGRIPDLYKLVVTGGG